MKPVVLLSCLAAVALAADPKLTDLAHDAAQLRSMLKAEDLTKGVAFLGDHGIPVLSDATGNYNIDEDAYGTPADAIRQVEKIIAAGADEILFLVQMGTIPHEISMETIRNLGEHVIPHFRKKAAA